MKIVLSLLVICLMMAGCERYKYVDVEFKVSNKTERTVRVGVTGRSGDHSVTVEPGGKRTLVKEKGTYGIYMLDYLFEKCELYEGERLVRTYSNEAFEGFFDPNRWEDALDEKGRYSDEDWDDECTYVVLPEDLE